MGIFSRLSFIYIISLILLSYPRERAQFIPEKTLAVLTERREFFKNHYEDRHTGELLLSYVAGENKGLTKEIKNAHKLLNLSHLFTPGGIHLTSLYILFFPLLFFLKRKSRKMHFAFTFSLAFLPFFLPRMWAIKRMAILRVLKLITDKLPVRPSFFQLFIVSFAADFLVGTFHHSPLSFIYSFLFLGIIFTSSDYPKIFLPFTLLGGQIIASFFQSEAQTVVGFILGFILTGAFEFLFPIFFITFWLAPYFSLGGEFFISLYWKAILFSAEIAMKSGFFDCSLPLTMCVIILSLRVKPNIKLFLCSFLLLIHSNSLQYRKPNLAKDKVFLYLEGPNPRRPPCRKKLRESKSNRSSAKDASYAFQSAPRKYSSSQTKLIISDTTTPNIKVKAASDAASVFMPVRKLRPSLFTKKTATRTEEKNEQGIH